MRGDHIASMLPIAPEARNSTRRVWFDIGVAGHSDFQVDVADRSDLLVVAIEPTPASFARFERYGLAPQSGSDEELGTELLSENAARRRPH